MKKTFLLIIALLPSFSLYTMDQMANDDALCKGIEEFYSYFDQKSPKNPSDMIKDSRYDDYLTQLLSIPGAPAELSAPWRIAYVKEVTAQTASSTSTVATQKQCPFCSQCADSATDDKNYFIDRGTDASTLMNLHGISPLHFLTIPHSHVSSLGQLKSHERKEFFTLMARLVKRVNDRLKIPAFRYVMNLEHRCTGASIPDHLHGHMIGKFEGETISLSRYLMGPFLTAERQGNYFKEFRHDGDASKIKPVYETFVRVLQLAQRVVKPAQATKNGECGSCLVAADRDQVIYRSENFTVFYNPIGAYPGECFIVGDHSGQPFQELPFDQQEELSQLLAKSTQYIKEVAGCNGISLSWEYDKDKSVHSFKARVTPRFDAEAMTFMVHYNVKSTGSDRELQRNQLREKFKTNKEL